MTSADAGPSTPPRKRLYMIVEGGGEQTAGPILLRAIVHEWHNRREQEVDMRALCGKGQQTLLGGSGGPGQLDRFLETLRANPHCAGALVLLDAEKRSDRDGPRCPVQLAQGVSAKARRLNLPFPVAVVCAVCEFESWFLYDMALLEGYISEGAAYAGDPEQECSAKGWIRRHGQNRYKPSTHQAKVTGRLKDEHLLALEERSRSFRRLVAAVDELLAAITGGRTDVTPAPPRAAATPPAPTE